MSREEGQAMRRIALLLVFLVPGSVAAATADLAAGLAEALAIGVQRVIGQLGRPDGFLNNPDVHIPLPAPLDQARPALRLIGLGSLADDLEVRLNRTAEQATPIAAGLLIRAIQDLSFADATAILNGPADAATRYLERATGEPLARRMRPIIEDGLAEAGALRAFDSLVGQYKTLPFMPDLKADLTGHVVAHTQRAIFDHLGTEEAWIRADTAARTTQLLKWVFRG